MYKNQLFSTNFQSGNWTYFLDVKKTKDGNKYLKITESKRISDTDFNRYQIILYCKEKTVVDELSVIFERNEGAINTRIKKLALKEKY